MTVHITFLIPAWKDALVSRAARQVGRSPPLFQVMTICPQRVWSKNLVLVKVAVIDFHQFIYVRAWARDRSYQSPRTNYTHIVEQTHSEKRCRSRICCPAESALWFPRCAVGRRPGWWECCSSAAKEIEEANANAGSIDMDGRGNDAVSNDKKDDNESRPGDEAGLAGWANKSLRCTEIELTRVLYVKPLDQRLLQATIACLR